MQDSAEGRHAGQDRFGSSDAAQLRAFLPV